MSIIPLAYQLGRRVTRGYLAVARIRPVTEWVALRDQSEQPELGMVYMLPLGMKPGNTILGDIIAAAVQLIDNDKAVMIHADNPETARVVKAATVAFAGGGHA